MPPSVAIVTTLKLPGPSFASFLKYHEAIGFTRFFLFFDDPADPWIKLARKYAHTRIIKSDARLRRAWQRTKTALTNPWFFQYVDAELKVRQTLNLEIAINLAKKENIEWLLHIDADELFYPLRGDAPAHFSAMSKRKRNNVIYANYEGVPESAEIDDYFREVTLFKKNFLLSRKRLDASQQKLIKKVPQLPDHLFLFYANGKSAARVTRGLEPDGGHRFKYPKGNGVGGSRNPALSQDALILHYPGCGFKNFWRKYKMLGTFPDRWFDQVNIVDAIGSFHLESRDVVARGDRRAARAFYETRAVLRETNLVERLIDKGICCRINGPSTLLNAPATEH
jgi:hypothetical protein